MTPAGFVPGRHHIDAILDGGFRFAEMSHNGSILLLPHGVFAWSPQGINEVLVSSFDHVLASRDEVDFLLVGSGETMLRLPEAVRWAFSASNIRCDVMSTAAAARTYNIMLAENRRVAAALIAVRTVE